MNLFILSIYDSGYRATMYENGFKIDLTTEENRNAFICGDGDIDVADSFSWEEIKK